MNESIALLPPAALPPSPDDACPGPGLGLGAGARRQLELTVGSLSRATRRSVRQAEYLERAGAAHEEQVAAWSRVEQRCQTLGHFVQAISSPAPQQQQQSQTSAPPADHPPEPKAGEPVPPLFDPESPPDPEIHAQLTALQHMVALPVANRQQARRKLREIDKALTRLERRDPALAARLRQSIQEE